MKSVAALSFALSEMGHRGPLHLDRQQARMGSIQTCDMVAAADELVTAGDQPAMDPWPLEAEIAPLFAANHHQEVAVDEIMGGAGQLRRHPGVGWKVRDAGQRHFKTRKQGTRIHIVLDQRLADHDIADMHADIA
jgi:hypothetical protein